MCNSYILQKKFNHKHILSGPGVVALQQLLGAGAGGAKDLPVVGADRQASVVRNQVRRQAAQA